MRRIGFWAAVSFVTSLVACGSAPPPPPEEPKKEAKPQKVERVPEIKADIGGLNERDVNRTFEKLLRRVESCQDDRRKQNDKLDFVSGDVSIEVRVGEDGSVHDVFMTKSTIGDRDVEKCIARAAKALDWPKPVGGREGIAKNEFSLPMKAERDAVAWDAQKIAGKIAKANEKLRACTSGKKGFEVTAYVDTDGKVITAGSTTPGDGAEAAADCLVDVVKKIRMPSPGGFPAKVSIDLD